jgi:hypothetical protein
MEYLVTHQAVTIPLALLSQSPGEEPRLDMTDWMIPAESETANILDVRKAVESKLILVFIYRHDLRVVSLKIEIYKTTSLSVQAILFLYLI